MPRYDITVKTAPTVEPVSTTEAKLYLRIDHADEDSLIGALITAARQHAENYTRRTLVDTVYYLDLDYFPAQAVRLPRGPLDSVVGVSYTDTAGDAATLTATTDYVVNEEAIPPTLEPAYGKSWPSTYSMPQSVRIEYKAGYGAAGSDVPAAIRTAILMLVAQWYTYREPVVIGVTAAKVPGAVDALLSPYVIHDEF